MNLYLKFFNLVSFISSLFINVLTINGFGPFKSIANISNEYNTLITPPNWAFSIWGIIYLGLFVFIFCQFVNNVNINNLISDIGNKFILSCLFNITWLISFCYGTNLSITSSIFLIIGLFISLFLIQTKCNFFKENIDCTRLFCFAIPFSLYLGWITIATLVNIATIIDLYIDVSNSYTIYISLICVAFIFMVFNLYKYNNYISSLVFIYVLVSLSIKNYVQIYLFEFTLILCFIFIILYILKIYNIYKTNKIKMQISNMV